jgi:predicted transcriptional regulator
MKKNGSLSNSWGGKRLRFCISLFLVLIIILSSSQIVFSELTQPMDITYRSANNQELPPRSLGHIDGDVEPNDNFAQATIIQNDPFGTTHILNQSVGATDQSDFWLIYTDRGTHDYKNNEINSTIKPDKIHIQLSFNESNQGPKGVFMTIYDSEYHELGKSDVAIEGDPVIITFIAQLNPYIYIKIESSIPESSSKYVFAVINATEPFNPAYGNNEKFSTAIEVNITAGEEFNDDEQYLDKGYDFADFYKFNATVGQSIKIELQILSNANDDFDMFLYNDSDINSLVKKSTRYNQDEQIEHVSPDSKLYYLRVAVKDITDDNLRNQGKYKLTLSGNLPPLWNSSFPDKYVMYEDGPKLIVDLNYAFYDMNPLDNVYFEVWDPSMGANGGWTNTFDTFSLKNATVTQRVDRSIKINTKPNKFGAEIIKVRATDDTQVNYTQRNIRIIIKPTNDPPVINGTNAWRNLGKSVTPSNDGKKLIGQEGKYFECTVTAYEPHDPWDSITFSDNSDMFDINPKTGRISFPTNFTHTGTHEIKITAHDNGTPQMNTTREFEFIIESCSCGPEVGLLTPNNNYIITSTNPEFNWQLLDDTFLLEETYFDFYISEDRSHIETRSVDALLVTLKGVTNYSVKSPLTDKTVYYWSVIPNDGLHLGVCVSGIFSFEVRLGEPIPKVELISPPNNQIITITTVTLNWNLDYNGASKVSYEVYLGISVGELQNPAFPPRDIITERTYKIKDLLFDKTYYWKIIPFTPKVRGNSSEIYSFHLDKIVAEIKLKKPVNNSIMLPNEYVKFSWDIIYSNPEKVINILYWSTSPDFDNYYSMELNLTRNFEISDLKVGSYYWKVVPIQDGLRGPESETWVFNVMKIEVPKALTLEPINTTIYYSGETMIVILTWTVEYRGGFSLDDVYYDVYMDNSTNIPGKMRKVSPDDYRQTYLPVIITFEEKQEYHWYVIPYLNTEEGLITGVCRSGVVNFDLGELTRRYNLGFALESELIKADPGTSELIYFTVRNLGNQRTTVDLSIHSNAEEFITTTFELSTVTLDIGENKRLALNVKILTTAELGMYYVNITAVARESTVIKAWGEFDINVTQEPIPKIESEKNEFLQQSSLIFLVILIIIILISIFSYSKIKRHRLLQHQRREKIYNYVKEKPGEHFRAIQKALELEVGVLAHHINKLEREEFIKSRQNGQYRRFYPMDAKIDVKLILSRLQERIMNFIKKNPGHSGSSIASHLEIDPKLVNYHVKVLQKSGFIYVEERGRETLCYSAAGI